MVTMEPETLWTLGGFCALNLAAASSGALFKPGAWYAQLRKPGWVPPNWAFPVVWSALYVANAVAGWRVFEASGGAIGPALVLYVLSLCFNAGWSALFFGLRRMDWALGEVSILWLSLAAVVCLFAPIDPLAAALLTPYLAWVSVAAFLNLRMVQLNPRPQP